MARARRSANRNPAPARRRRQRTQQARPIVVVQRSAAPRRRRNRRKASKNQGSWRPWNVYDLKCDSGGVLTFGPSSDNVNLGGGVLKAYSEYRIRALRVEWKSEAASTTAGSMAIQVGLGKSLTAVDNRAIAFKLTTNGSRTFGAKALGGDGRMYSTGGSSSGEDQFRLAYKGNGKPGEVAGSLHCFFQIELSMPK